MNNKKILVIHNDKNFQTRLHKKLQNLGYQVLLTSDGLSGLHYVYNENPNLIIIRSMLPQLNGWEICSLIKRNFQYRDIPVTMVSIYTGEVVRDANQEKPDCILRSPFKLDALLNKIKELLSRYDSKKEQASQTLKKQAENRLKEYYKNL